MKSRTSRGLATSSISKPLTDFAPLEYNEAVRCIDLKPNATSAKLVEVPLDPDRRKTAARKRHPDGFPKSCSNDAARRIFHGHPCGPILRNDERESTTGGSVRTDAMVLVAHDPNVVVNGAAEMVHARDFRNGQCRAEKCGAMQEKVVREEVCELMEGGREAFSRRWARLGRKA